MFTLSLKRFSSKYDPKRHPIPIHREIKNLDYYSNYGNYRKAEATFFIIFYLLKCIFEKVEFLKYDMWYLIGSLCRDNQQRFFRNSIACFGRTGELEFEVADGL